MRTPKKKGDRGSLPDSPDKKSAVSAQASTFEVSSIELNASDFECPICMYIMIEPVTLPCTHELCLKCFKDNYNQTSSTCPLCRTRIAVWSRQASKTNSLVNIAKWELIQQNFPNAVKHAQGVNVIGNELDEAEPKAPVHIICQPGEIGKEFEYEMKKKDEELRRQREEEEARSAELIERLRRENQLSPSRSNDPATSDLELDPLASEMLWLQRQKEEEASRLLIEQLQREDSEFEQLLLQSGSSSSSSTNTLSSQQQTPLLQSGSLSTAASSMLPSQQIVQPKQQQQSLLRSGPSSSASTSAIPSQQQLQREQQKTLHREINDWQDDLWYDQELLLADAQQQQLLLQASSSSHASTSTLTSQKQPQKKLRRKINDWQEDCDEQKVLLSDLQQPKQQPLLQTSLSSQTSVSTLPSQHPKQQKQKQKQTQREKLIEWQENLVREQELQVFADLEKQEQRSGLAFEKGSDGPTDFISQWCTGTAGDDCDSDGDYDIPDYSSACALSNVNNVKKASETLTNVEGTLKSPKCKSDDAVKSSEFEKDSAVAGCSRWSSSATSNHSPTFQIASAIFGKATATSGGPPAASNCVFEISNSNSATSQKATSTSVSPSAVFSYASAFSNSSSATSQKASASSGQVSATSICLSAKVATRSNQSADTAITSLPSAVTSSSVSSASSAATKYVLASTESVPTSTESLLASTESLLAPSASTAPLLTSASACLLSKISRSPGTSNGSVVLALPASSLASGSSSEVMKPGQGTLKASQSGVIQAAIQSSTTSNALPRSHRSASFTHRSPTLCSPSMTNRSPSMTHCSPSMAHRSPPMTRHSPSVTNRSLSMSNCSPLMNHCSPSCFKADSTSSSSGFFSPTICESPLHLFGRPTALSSSFSAVRESKLTNAKNLSDFRSLTDTENITNTKNLANARDLASGSNLTNSRSADAFVSSTGDSTSHRKNLFKFSSPTTTSASATSNSEFSESKLSLFSSALARQEATTSSPQTLSLSFSNSSSTDSHSASKRIKLNQDSKLASLPVGNTDDGPSRKSDWAPANQKRKFSLNKVMNKNQNVLRNTNVVCVTPGGARRSLSDVTFGRSINDLTSSKLVNDLTSRIAPTESLPSYHLKSSIAKSELHTPNSASSLHCSEQVPSRSGLLKIMVKDKDGIKRWSKVSANDRNIHLSSLGSENTDSKVSTAANAMIDNSSLTGGRSSGIVNVAPVILSNRVDSSEAGSSSKAVASSNAASSNSIASSLPRKAGLSSRLSTSSKLSATSAQIASRSAISSSTAGAPRGTSKEKVGFKKTIVASKVLNPAVKQNPLLRSNPFKLNPLAKHNPFAKPLKFENLSSSVKFNPLFKPNSMANPNTSIKSNHMIKSDHSVQPNETIACTESTCLTNPLPTRSAAAIASSGGRRKILDNVEIKYLYAEGIHNPCRADDKNISTAVSIAPCDTATETSHKLKATAGTNALSKRSPVFGSKGLVTSSNKAAEAMGLSYAAQNAAVSKFGAASCAAKYAVHSAYVSKSAATAGSAAAISKSPTKCATISKPSAAASSAVSVSLTSVASESGSLASASQASVGHTTSTQSPVSTCSAISSSTASTSTPLAWNAKKMAGRKAAKHKSSSAEIVDLALSEEQGTSQDDDDYKVALKLQRRYDREARLLKYPSRSKEEISLRRKSLRKHF